uniref:hypothetical protein n=1 Tax=Streptomyces sp. NBC_00857 TaxID=2975851 RepID=UPI002F919CCE
MRGQGVREPAVDIGLDVPARAPGEFVPDGFVAVAGLGLPQRAQFAQRLELIGAGLDPGGSRSSASRASAAAGSAASSAWTTSSESGS